MYVIWVHLPPCNSVDKQSIHSIHFFGEGANTNSLRDLQIFNLRVEDAFWSVFSTSSLADDLVSLSNPKNPAGFLRYPEDGIGSRKIPH